MASSRHFNTKPQKTVNFQSTSPKSVLRRPELHLEIIDRLAVKHVLDSIKEDLYSRHILTEIDINTNTIETAAELLGVLRSRPETIGEFLWCLSQHGSFAKFPLEGTIAEAIRLEGGLQYQELPVFVPNEDPFIINIPAYPDNPELQSPVPKNESANTDSSDQDQTDTFLKIEGKHFPLLNQRGDALSARITENEKSSTNPQNCSTDSIQFKMAKHLKNLMCYAYAIIVMVSPILFFILYLYFIKDNPNPADLTNSTSSSPIHKQLLTISERQTLPRSILTATELRSSHSLSLSNSTTSKFLPVTETTASSQLITMSQIDHQSLQTSQQEDLIVWTSFTNPRSICNGTGQVTLIISVTHVDFDLLDVNPKCSARVSSLYISRPFLYPQLIRLFQTFQNTKMLRLSGSAICKYNPLLQNVPTSLLRKLTDLRLENLPYCQKLYQLLQAIPSNLTMLDLKNNIVYPSNYPLIENLIRKTKALSFEGQIDVELFKGFQIPLQLTHFNFNVSKVNQRAIRSFKNILNASPNLQHVHSNVYLHDEVLTTIGNYHPHLELIELIIHGAQNSRNFSLAPLKNLNNLKEIHLKLLFTNQSWCILNNEDVILTDIFPSPAKLERITIFSNCKMKAGAGWWTWGRVLTRHLHSKVFLLQIFKSYEEFISIIRHPV